MNFQSSLGILRGMLRILVFIFCVFAFCEYIIYYVVLVQCTWPQLDNGHQSYSQKPLKIALISDTHLLGTRRGHWFDKLRR